MAVVIILIVGWTHICLGLRQKVGRLSRTLSCLSLNWLNTCVQCLCKLNCLIRFFTVHFTCSPRWWNYWQIFAGRSQHWLPMRAPEPSFRKTLHLLMWSCCKRSRDTTPCWTQSCMNSVCVCVCVCVFLTFFVSQCFFLWVCRSKSQLGVCVILYLSLYNCSFVSCRNNATLKWRELKCNRLL